MLVASKGHEHLTSALPSPTATDYLLVRSEYKLHKVWYRDILFIENLRDYVRFFLADGTRLMSLMSLKSLEHTLPRHFMRVHRSYMVNLDAVHTIERNRVVFDEQRVPVADAHREAFLRAMKLRTVN